MLLKSFIKWILYCSTLIASSFYLVNLYVQTPLTVMQISLLTFCLVICNFTMLELIGSKSISRFNPQIRLFVKRTRNLKKYMLSNVTKDESLFLALIPYSIIFDIKWIEKHPHFSATHLTTTQFDFSIIDPKLKGVELHQFNNMSEPNFEHDKKFQVSESLYIFDHVKNALDQHFSHFNDDFSGILDLDGSDAGDGGDGGD